MFKVVDYSTVDNTKFIRVIVADSGVIIEIFFLKIRCLYSVIGISSHSIPLSRALFVRCIVTL